MSNISEFFRQNFNLIVIILLLFSLLRTCNNDSRVLSKKIDILSEKIDSLSVISVTRKDLIIEGLKSEKRMIQSTDRKMLDVSRQSEIDKEIENFSK